jgi:uncharacterized membrane protein
MDSQAKILGHPLHPMLIAFPLGLLGTAAIFDAVHLGTGEPRWADISFWMIVAGVIGGLAAAVPGLIDWLAIPSGTRAKAVGAWHGIGNVIVIVLFAISLFLRWDDPGAPPVAAFVLSYGGVALALVTAWLGGELVDRLGVGVDTGAHLNAPSSLSDLPASAASEGRLPAGPATAD